MGYGSGALTPQCIAQSVSTPETTFALAKAIHYNFSDSYGDCCPILRHIRDLFIHTFAQNVYYLAIRSVRQLDPNI